MLELNWVLILALGTTGIGMALLSALVGMRQKVENPAWWLLYAVWIAIVLGTDAPGPFRTILLSSVLAGILHGATISFLIGAYVRNNPWYADQMKAPRPKLVRQFVLTGVGVGAGFGAVTAGIAWAVERYLL